MFFLKRLKQAHLEPNPHNNFSENDAFTVAVQVAQLVVCLDTMPCDPGSTLAVTTQINSKLNIKTMIRQRMQ